MRPDDDLSYITSALDDNYELVRELGGTNATVVYLARVRSSGRMVALKTIRRQFLRNPEAVARFSREARAMSTLQHPNIVRTIAIEQSGDRTIAIVMEYLEGGSLREILRSHGALSFDRARSILRDLGEALSYAHERGIVHRDVKPENIYIAAESGRALLSDFGIAREIEADTRLTLAGSAVGTPSYMAPEQIDGQVVDERSDIYSLGVLGWELVTGLRPWDGETLYSVIYKQKHEELPAIRTLRADTPASLREAIEGAMRKHAADRWPSARAFLDRLADDADDSVSDQAEGDDRPTLRFRRPEETMVGVPLADVAPDESHRPTAPIEREVSLQQGREPTFEVAQEPEVLKPRVTQARKRLNPPVPATDVEVTPQSSTARTVEPNDAEEVEPSEAAIESEIERQEDHAIALSHATADSDRRDSVRIPPAMLGVDVEPLRVPPPHRRNPLVVAVPAAIALAAALFLFAGRDDSGSERDELIVSDSVVSSASGGSVTVPGPRDTGELRAPVQSRRASQPPAVRPPSPGTPQSPETSTRTQPAVASSPQRVVDPVPAPDVPRQAPVPELPKAPRVQEPAVNSAPLNDRIADNDVELNTVYQELIRALRAGQSGSEPAEVRELRAQQRDWLMERDRACRLGTIDTRASCFREQSRQRSAELTRLLERARAAPDSSPRDRSGH